MKECGVYHCENLGDGKVCYLAAHLQSQAEHHTVGTMRFTKKELLCLVEKTQAMANEKMCSCQDQIALAVTFARGVAETLA